MNKLISFIVLFLHLLQLQADFVEDGYDGYDGYDAYDENGEALVRKVPRNETGRCKICKHYIKCTEKVESIDLSAKFSPHYDFVPRIVENVVCVSCRNRKNKEMPIDTVKDKTLIFIKRKQSDYYSEHKYELLNGCDCSLY